MWKEKFRIVMLQNQFCLAGTVLPQKFLLQTLLKTLNTANNALKMEERKYQRVIILIAASLKTSKDMDSLESKIKPEKEMQT